MYATRIYLINVQPQPAPLIMTRQQAGVPNGQTRRRSWTYAPLVMINFNPYHMYTTMNIIYIVIELNPLVMINVTSNAYHMYTVNIIYIIILSLTPGHDQASAFARTFTR